MEATSASQQRMDFLSLLVTELRHQNPLDPMDNQQMASQLAQFSQLDLTETMNDNIGTMNASIEKLNSSFEGAMLVAQLDYAKSLLGKQVQFYYADYDRMVEGKVDRIFFRDGNLTLEVDSVLTHPDGSSSNEPFYVRLDAVEGIRL